MRILVLGIGQSNFLLALFRRIKKERANWWIATLGLHDMSKNSIKHASDAFDEIVNVPKGNRISFRIFFNIFFWRVVLNRLSNSGFSGVGKLARDFSAAQKLSRQFNGKYDLLHFHFIEAKNILPIFFLHKSCKIVCSFWGSDLLRRSSNFEHFLVQKALQRSDVITMQSLELREIMLSKFGRDLLPKTCVNRFILDDTLFRQMKSFNYSNSSSGQYDATGIDESRINIVIGHNAFRENRHLEIISELSRIDDQSKKGIKLILPMTYGMNPERRGEYQGKIRQALFNSGFSYHIIDKFLSTDQLIYLRGKTDIFIHLPISDALSGAATEAMYAGSILVTGAWLPYGPFRRAKLDFVEVDRLEDLGHVIIQIIKELPVLKGRVCTNRETISKKFLEDNECIETWIEVYEH